MSAEDEVALICVTTQFTSIDDLVAKAGLLVSGDKITVAAAPLPMAGQRRRFQVVLSDGTVAIEGLGEVIAGKRLRIVELEPASKEVHARILATRKPLPAPGGGRAAPPAPFRKTIEGPPPPAAAVEPTPAAIVVAPPAVDPTPAPAPVVAPIVAAPRPPPDETVLVSAAWRPPPWLVTRHAKIAITTFGAIMLIGIVAALAGGGSDGAPPAPTTIAGAAPPDAGAAAAPATDAMPAEDEPDAEPSATDAGAEAAPEPDPEPPPKKAPPKKTATKPPRPPPKKTTTKPPPPKKKPSKARQVRLAVRSQPAGASLKVDGGSVSGGAAMVTAGSTVTVTATLRGYKRARKTVKVDKAMAVVVKLERM